MDEQKTTDMPSASGSDEWWRAAAASVDVAEREKQAIAAEDFQGRRVQAYLESGGQTDIGGWRGHRSAAAAKSTHGAAGRLTGDEMGERALSELRKRAPA